MFGKKKVTNARTPLVILMALTLCGKISANQGFNCDYPLQGGAEDTLILINWEDWLDAAITYNVSNPLIIENIVLASGVYGYEMQGKNNSHAPMYEMVPQEFAEMWSHEINYKVFNVSPAAKQQMMKKTKGRFVAIIYNKYKGQLGDSAFEVYGADAGLKVTQMKRDLNNQDNQGAFDIILKTAEKSLEPSMPKTLFINDYADSKAVAESLIAA